MLYFVLAALGLFAIHKAKPVTSAASTGLPWSPPVTVKPIMTKRRDTSVTKFPVDVWVWTIPTNDLSQLMTYQLVVASDDRSSFAAYMKASNGQKILTAKGTGALTQQILDQI